MALRLECHAMINRSAASILLSSMVKPPFQVALPLYRGHLRLHNIISFFLSSQNARSASHCLTRMATGGSPSTNWAPSSDPWGWTPRSQRSERSQGARYVSARASVVSGIARQRSNVVSESHPESRRPLPFLCSFDSLEYHIRNFVKKLQRELLRVIYFIC